jgi:hypothetical protein
VGGVADLVDVGGPQALLAVGEQPAGGVGSAEQVRQERMHTGGGEQDRGVGLGDEGGAGEDGMSAVGEERQEHRPQPVGVDHPDHRRGQPTLGLLRDGKLQVVEAAQVQPGPVGAMHQS